MSDLFSQSSLSNSQVEILSETDEKQFLRFHLYPDTKAMLPIRQITEVLKIKLGQIVPIPQMPAWVMGVHNWRGEILWMLDLGHLMGLYSWYQQEVSHSTQTAIVLAPDRESNSAKSNIQLGLVVSQVADIEMCSPQMIQMAMGNVSSQLQPFLQGYWLQPSGDMILVLDGQAIVDAMPKSN